MKFFLGCDLDARESCPAFLANRSDTMKSRTGGAGNAETALPLFLLCSPISDHQDEKLKSSGRMTGWLRFLKNY